MSLSRSCRLLTGIAVLAALLVVSPGARAENGINAVGTLERFPQEAVDAFGPGIVPNDDFDPDGAVNGTLLPVPGAGQLWQVYVLWEEGITGVLVRDARNLKVIGSFRLPQILTRRTGGEWLHTTDGGNRVFLVNQRRELLEVDASTFTMRTYGVLSVSGLDLGPRGGLDPVLVGGMSYDHVTGKLLVLYGGPPFSALNKLTVLQQVDVSGPPGSGLSAVNRVVRSCMGPLPATDFGGDTYATAPLVDIDAVYVPCQQMLLPISFQLPTAIIVRLPRTSLFEELGTESSVTVGDMMNAPLLDAAAGRITVLHYFGTMTVVDARAMRVVGSFAASNDQARTGAGLDPSTGRVFFQSDLGLGYVDARGTAPFTPTIATSAAADGQERIVTNGNRIYVLPGAPFAGPKPDHYTIYNVAS